MGLLHLMNGSLRGGGEGATGAVVRRPPRAMLGLKGLLLSRLAVVPPGLGGAVAMTPSSKCIWGQIWAELMERNNVQK